jgi:hypothetical protein
VRIKSVVTAVSRASNRSVCADEKAKRLVDGHYVELWAGPRPLEELLRNGPI